MIASSLAHLHGDTIELARMGNNLHKQTGLTEKGAIVPGLYDYLDPRDRDWDYVKSTPYSNRHEVLTGSSVGPEFRPVRFLEEVAGPPPTQGAVCELLRPHTDRADLEVAVQQEGEIVVRHRPGPEKDFVTHAERRSGRDPG